MASDTEIPKSGRLHHESRNNDESHEEHLSLRPVDEVLADRENEYGSAERNFAAVGRGWGAILGIEDIPAYKVALMMDFFKTIRCVANPNHDDSWIDKQGYTQHGHEIANES